MVKLQKHKAYVYTSGEGIEIEHFKHLITLPEDILKDMRWNEGQEFEWVKKGDSLVLVPKANNQSK